MARNKKKGKQRKYGTYGAQNDISICEYADSVKKLPCTSRIKKASVSSVPKLEKMISDTNETLATDLNWYEKDLDDLDFRPTTQTPGAQAELPGDANHVDEVQQDSRNGKTKKKRKNVGAVNNTGIVYPIDVWYILSDYIAPEYTGKYAAICKAANRVVHTFGFWKHIYLRYYSRDVSLPAELQSENLERLHGLRGRVIRALFYIYPPLVSRTRTTIPFENEPHHLEGKRCILSWHMMIKANVWNFCFKFSEDGAFCDNNHLEKGVDLLNGYRDLFYNPEDRCCVLQVSCQNFQYVHSIMGLLLNKVYLSVSRDMRHHQLKLVFHHNLLQTSHSVPETTVILDPVINLRVFDWWDPSYPFFTQTKT